MPAQGNALGLAAQNDPALKGRPNAAAAAMERPVGADAISTQVPRALPWAGMDQAVGLSETRTDLSAAHPASLAEKSADLSAAHPASLAEKSTDLSAAHPASLAEKSTDLSDTPAAGLAEPDAPGWAGVTGDSFRYIEISDLHSDGTVADTTLPLRAAPSRATQYVRAGDVLTSTVRPNRRLSAIVSPEQDGCVASSGFIVLQPRAVPAEVLLTYLRLPLFCELMDLHTSASLYPAISDRDLLALPFPEIPAAASAAITAAVRSAHTARARARTLLARAQRAVEIAIEEHEAAALAFLVSAAN